MRDEMRWQNKYTSVGKVRPRQVKLPWLNSQILKLLKQKSLKLFRLHRTPESKNDFIKIRNQRTTQGKYNIFPTANHPIQSLYSRLLKSSPETMKKKRPNLQISLHGSLISDSEKIANAFNEYFILSVQGLESVFPTTSHSISPPSSTTDMISFFEITQDDVMKNVNALKRLPQSW